MCLWCWAVNLWAGIFSVGPTSILHPPLSLKHLQDCAATAALGTVISQQHYAMYGFTLRSCGLLVGRCRATVSGFLQRGLATAPAGRRVRFNPFNCSACLFEGYSNQYRCATGEHLYCGRSPRSAPTHGASGILVAKTRRRDCPLPRPSLASTSNTDAGTAMMGSVAGTHDSSGRLRT